MNGENTMELKAIAEKICTEAIKRALPDAAVRRALEGRTFGEGKVIVVAV